MGLGFRMFRAFQSDYTDSTTTAYQELAENVTTEVNHGYKRIYPLTYVRCRIIQFTSGSIIVNMTLIFKNQTVVPNVTSVEQGLNDSLSHGNTFLDIDTTSITARTTTSAATTFAATTTATPTTTTTAGPTPNTAASTTSVVETTINNAAASSGITYKTSLLICLVMLSQLLD
ncbi:UV excision repair protein RAD23 homolog [Oncorhynchus mykiss]|uniref:UV excision repair protein RAD23 homolog n=1 Tax=Oncorhynchus mykiss TaxID=8022 RepID=UPI001878B7B3|nr:UV excision repair protein RAD23 homolog [Oncorhynchus mykiss]